MAVRALASCWVCGAKGIISCFFHNSLNVPINRNFYRDLRRRAWPRGVNLEWFELSHLFLSVSIPYLTPQHTSAFWEESIVFFIIEYSYIVI